MGLAQPERRELSGETLNQWRTAVRDHARKHFIVSRTGRQAHYLHVRNADIQRDIRLSMNGITHALGGAVRPETALSIVALPELLRHAVHMGAARDKRGKAHFDKLFQTATQAVQAQRDRILSDAELRHRRPDRAGEVHQPGRWSRLSRATRCWTALVARARR